jgi:hypothetical protein
LYLKGDRFKFFNYTVHGFEEGLLDGEDRAGVEASDQVLGLEVNGILVMQAFQIARNLRPQQR